MRQTVIDGHRAVGLGPRYYEGPEGNHGMPSGLLDSDPPVHASHAAGRDRDVNHPILVIV